MILGAGGGGKKPKGEIREERKQQIRKGPAKEEQGIIIFDFPMNFLVGV